MERIEQMLSSKAALFASLVPFTAGGTLMAFGHIEWGCIFLALGGAMVLLFLLFIRQHIDISGIECSIRENITMSDDFHPIGISGFIKVRHAIELLDCRLMVARDKKEYYISSSGFSLQDIIDNLPRSFTFHIPVGGDYMGELLDWGLVYIRVKGELLYTNPFPLKTQKHSREGWFKEMVKKLIQKTNRLKDKGEITKKQLHELLDKASQPIKKSEKGKT